MITVELLSGPFVTGTIKVIRMFESCHSYRTVIIVISYIHQWRQIAQLIIRDYNFHSTRKRSWETLLQETNQFYSQDYYTTNVLS